VKLAKQRLVSVLRIFAIKPENILAMKRKVKEELVHHLSRLSITAGGQGG
jgi:hypothetical protein